MRELCCPVCHQLRIMDYDRFEDMYRCGTCETFLYPGDVGLEDDRTAPIFALGE